MFATATPPAPHPLTTALDWLALGDHNTQIAVLGAGCLGAATGLVGTFLVLRRRALMADTLGHSTLPGIGLAFVLLAAIGAAPRSQPVLLLGAAMAAMLAAGLVAIMQRLRRVREDAALAITLGCLFGLGLVVLGVIQQLGTGNATGLDDFLDGSIATMRVNDAWLMAGLALLAASATIALFKEFTLMAFDPEQARLQGLPVRRLEAVQLVLVVLVTVAGLRAVGLILIIAMLVIPAAAARFWSNHLPRVAAFATGIGALSGIVGAWISAQASRLPAGALIVLVASSVFGLSLCFGSARGIWRRTARSSPTLEVI
ncbi:MAG: metal ABC transporter permease [bacterium]|nr:metal ABC transporter permease [bacterium]